MSPTNEKILHDLEAARDELNKYIENINNLNSSEREELLRLSRKVDELLNKFLKESNS